MQVLITGASGFIGKALCRHLAAQGHAVIAATRTGAAVDGAARAVTLDFPISGNAHAALQMALSESNAVVHLAGIAHRRADPVAYREINVLGTEWLARTAQALGVPRFVFISSLLASEASGSSGPMNYERSKWQAEQVLSSIWSPDTAGLVILRPALIYGAGVGGNLAALRRAVRRGLPVPPPLGQGRAMVGLPDLVAAIDLALATRDDIPQPWIISDGQRYRLDRIVRALRAATGQRGDGLSVPAPLWRGACLLRDGLLWRQGFTPGNSYRQLFGGDDKVPVQFPGPANWQACYCLEDLAQAIMQVSP